MKLFKRKVHPRIEEYERGFVLQINNGIDNKQHFQEIKDEEIARVYFNEIKEGEAENGG